MSESVFIKMKKVKYLDQNGEETSSIVKRVVIFKILKQLSDLLKKEEAAVIFELLNGKEFTVEELVKAVVKLLPDFPNLLDLYIDNFDIEDVLDSDGLYDLVMAVYVVNFVPNIDSIKKKFGAFKK
ncbi:hypothetical protein MHB65_19940 [Lysinibacillus sp. FSL K6-0075]|uniref:hypothetical protein n=1 Tax=Lysinibacillus sp. FSL K6-0075 TaxID=2921415 RepID=UPI00315868D5